MDEASETLDYYLELFNSVVNCQKIYSIERFITNNIPKNLFILKKEIITFWCAVIVEDDDDVEDEDEDDENKNRRAFCHGVDFDVIRVMNDGGDDMIYIFF